MGKGIVRLSLNEARQWAIGLLETREEKRRKAADRKFAEREFNAWLTGFIAAQRPLDADIHKIINDNWWDLV